MNRILFILSLTGILMQNFTKVYILLNFQVNRDYIAKNLCVKKNEVNNCCKGKCQLQKQLEKDEKKHSSPNNTVKEKTETELFTQTSLTLGLKIYTLVNTIHTMYLCMVTKDIINSLFHPPPAITIFVNLMIC